MTAHGIDCASGPEVISNDATFANPRKRTRPERTKRRAVQPCCQLQVRVRVPSLQLQG